MNRETSSHFGAVPYIEKPRSTFTRPQKHLTTFNNGKLIPIYVDEVLPGDTMKLDVAGVVRMMTPLYPVMDDLIMDITAWYVPNRLVWEHWQEFQGENKLTAWEQPVKYEIPQITAPEGGWEKGTIADYMGIPTKVPNISVNALPFKAYRLIWNEFWRDENLKDRVMINTDDRTLAGSNGTGEDDTYITTGQLGRQPLTVARTHDYFSSALPDVQKGEAALIPITSRGSGGLVPIVNTGIGIQLTNGKTTGTLINESQSASIGASTLKMSSSANIPIGNTTSGGIVNTQATAIGLRTPSGLAADFNSQLDIRTVGTINELRTSFAVQRILEAMRRGGSRYTEILKNIWGVQAPDARLQRPEYLGGIRVPINMDQVIQTSETNTNGTPLGETGAFSNTAFSDFIAQKSFVEHGYIFVLACTRIRQHTFQQGLERMWSRKTMYDFYMPQMAYLGEQAILEKEIYRQGNGVLREDNEPWDEKVFGYQERWAEYRYKPNRVSGAMRSNYTEGTLDAWHYRDYYTSEPTLSSEWIDEGTAEVNRTLAVQDTLEDQFFGDFLITNKATRLMPIYSVPGLLDHY